jgi:hypothetical protein
MRIMVTSGQNADSMGRIFEQLEIIRNKQKKKLFSFND